MRPETSTKENPMKEYRNNSSRLDGFLPIEITNEAQVRPTPMATPIKAQEAIAPAINLKPKTSILKGSFIKIFFNQNRFTVSKVNAMKILKLDMLR